MIGLQVLEEIKKWKKSLIILSDFDTITHERATCASPVTYRILQQKRKK